jgi:DNA-binding transcriptional regulator/RsmH inhibitor MraZ
VRTALQNPEIRELVTKVDSSRHRVKKLHKMRKTSPEFNTFIDTVLKELGYLDKDGRVSLPEDLA